MAQDEDKGFFDRLGEILNAPLPGTPRPTSQNQAATDDEDDDDSLLERVKDILYSPLPGTHQTGTGNETSTTPVGQSGEAGTASLQADEKTPELDEDELDEGWWKQAVARSPGHKPPPPPWGMAPGAAPMPPRGGPMPGPMGGPPPPWMRPPGPGRRRS